MPTRNVTNLDPAYMTDEELKGELNRLSAVQAWDLSDKDLARMKRIQGVMESEVPRGLLKPTQVVGRAVGGAAEGLYENVASVADFVGNASLNLARLFPGVELEGVRAQMPQLKLTEALEEANILLEPSVLEQVVEGGANLAPTIFGMNMLGKLKLISALPRFTRDSVILGAIGSLQTSRQAGISNVKLTPEDWVNQAMQTVFVAGAGGIAASGATGLVNRLSQGKLGTVAQRLVHDASMGVLFEGGFALIEGENLEHTLQRAAEGVIGFTLGGAAAGLFRGPHAPVDNDTLSRSLKVTADVMEQLAIGEGGGPRKISPNVEASLRENMARNMYRRAKVQLDGSEREITPEALDVIANAHSIEPRRMREIASETFDAQEVLDWKLRQAAVEIAKGRPEEHAVQETLYQLDLMGKARRAAWEIRRKEIPGVEKAGVKIEEAKAALEADPELLAAVEGRSVQMTEGDLPFPLARVETGKFSESAVQGAQALETGRQALLRSEGLPTQPRKQRRVIRDFDTMREAREAAKRMKKGTDEKFVVEPMKDGKFRLLLEQVTMEPTTGANLARRLGRPELPSEKARKRAPKQLEFQRVKGTMLQETPAMRAKRLTGKRRVITPPPAEKLEGGKRFAEQNMAAWLRMQVPEVWTPVKGGPRKSEKAAKMLLNKLQKESPDKRFRISPEDPLVVERMLRPAEEMTRSEAVEARYGIKDKYGDMRQSFGTVQQAAEAIARLKAQNETRWFTRYGKPGSYKVKELLKKTKSTYISPMEAAAMGLSRPTGKVPQPRRKRPTVAAPSEKPPPKPPPDTPLVGVAVKKGGGEAEVIIPPAERPEPVEPSGTYHTVRRRRHVEDAKVELEKLQKKHPDRTYVLRPGRTYKFRKGRRMVTETEATEIQEFVPDAKREEWVKRQAKLAAERERRKKNAPPTVREIALEVHDLRDQNPEADYFKLREMAGNVERGDKRGISKLFVAQMHDAVEAWKQFAERGQLLRDFMGRMPTDWFLGGKEGRKAFLEEYEATRKYKHPGLSAEKLPEGVAKERAAQEEGFAAFSQAIDEVLGAPEAPAPPAPKKPVREAPAESPFDKAERRVPEQVEKLMRGEEVRLPDRPVGAKYADITVYSQQGGEPRVRARITSEKPRKVRRKNPATVEGFYTDTDYGKVLAEFDLAYVPGKSKEAYRREAFEKWLRDDIERARAKFTENFGEYPTAKAAPVEIRWATALGQGAKWSKDTIGKLVQVEAYDAKGKGLAAFSVESKGSWKETQKAARERYERDFDTYQKRWMREDVEQAEKITWRMLDRWIEQNVPLEKAAKAKERIQRYYKENPEAENKSFDEVYRLTSKGATVAGFEKGDTVIKQTDKGPIRYKLLEDARETPAGKMVARAVNLKTKQTEIDIEFERMGAQEAGGTPLFTAPAPREPKPEAKPEVPAAAQEALALELGQTATQPHLDTSSKRSLGEAERLRAKHGKSKRAEAVARAQEAMENMDVGEHIVGAYDRASPKEKKEIERLIKKRGIENMDERRKVEQGLAEAEAEVQAELERRASLKPDWTPDQLKLPLALIGIGTGASLLAATMDDDPTEEGKPMAGLILAAGIPFLFPVKKRGGAKPPPRRPPSGERPLRLKENYRDPLYQWMENLSKQPRETPTLTADQIYDSRRNAKKPNRTEFEREIEKVNEEIMGGENIDVVEGSWDTVRRGKKTGGGQALDNFVRTVGHAISRTYGEYGKELGRRLASFSSRLQRQWTLFQHKNRTISDKYRWDQQLRTFRIIGQARSEYESAHYLYRRVFERVVAKRDIPVEAAVTEKAEVAAMAHAYRVLGVTPESWAKHTGHTVTPEMAAGAIKLAESMQVRYDWIKNWAIKRLADTFMPWSRGPYNPMIVADFVWGPASSFEGLRKRVTRFNPFGKSHEEAVAEAREWQRLLAEDMVRKMKEAGENMTFDEAMEALRQHGTLRGRNPAWQYGIEEMVQKKDAHLDFHKFLDSRIGGEIDPALLFSRYFRPAMTRLHLAETFGPKMEFANSQIVQAQRDGYDVAGLIQLFDTATMQHSRLTQMNRIRWIDEFGGLTAFKYLGGAGLSQMTAYTRIPLSTDYKSFLRAFRGAIQAQIYQSSLLPEGIRRRWGSEAWAEFIAEAGPMGQAELVQAIMEMRGFFPKMAAILLKANLTTSLDRFGRNLAAIAGRFYAKDTLVGYEMAVKEGGVNSKRAEQHRRRLQELYGDDFELLEAALDVNRPPEQTKLLEVIGGQRVGDRTQGRTLPIDLPMMATHPVFRQLYKLQQFNIRMTAESIRQFDPRNPTSKVRTKNDMARFVTAMAAGVGFSAGIMHLKKLMRRADPDEMYDDPFYRIAAEWMAFWGFYPNVLDAWDLGTGRYGAPSDQILGLTARNMMEAADSMAAAWQQQTIDPAGRYFLRSIPVFYHNFLPIPTGRQLSQEIFPSRNRLPSGTGRDVRGVTVRRVARSGGERRQVAR